MTDPTPLTAEQLSEALAELQRRGSAPLCLARESRWLRALAAMTARVADQAREIEALRAYYLTNEMRYDLPDDASTRIRNAAGRACQEAYEQVDRFDAARAAERDAKTPPKETP